MAGGSGNTDGRGTDEPAGERRRRGQFNELDFREPEVDCCPISEPEFGASEIIERLQLLTRQYLD
jgi:hypothetical protein